MKDIEHFKAVHFSSKKMDWTTPQDFFDELNKEFNFQIDLAASESNTKCLKYFDENTNSLGNVGTSIRVGNGSILRTEET